MEVPTASPSASPARQLEHGYFMLLFRVTTGTDLHRVINPPGSIPVTNLARPTRSRSCDSSSGSEMPHLGCAHHLLSPQPGGLSRLLGYSKVPSRSGAAPLLRHWGTMPCATAGSHVGLAPRGPHKQPPRESPRQATKLQAKRKKKRHSQAVGAFLKLPNAGSRAGKSTPPRPLTTGGPRRCQRGGLRHSVVQGKVGQKHLQ